MVFNQIIESALNDLQNDCNDFIKNKECKFVKFVFKNGTENNQDVFFMVMNKNTNLSEIGFIKHIISTKGQNINALNVCSKPKILKKGRRMEFIFRFKYNKSESACSR